MISAEQFGAVKRPASFDRLLGDTGFLIRQAGSVILQVDSTVTRINGLAWLMAQRDASVAARLAALDVDAKAEEWTPERLACARLAVLRPRRSEVNALGRAYLEALAPGAVDAAHRIRSSGVAVGLSSDVAVEALFGVANALGVTPDDIHAPTIRFDALGSFTACEFTPRSTPRMSGGAGGGRVYIGAQPPTLGIATGDAFIRFTGFVEQDGVPATPEADSVGSFAELAALVAS